MTAPAAPIDRAHLLAILAALIRAGDKPDADSATWTNYVVDAAELLNAAENYVQVEE